MARLGLQHLVPPSAMLDHLPAIYRESDPRMADLCEVLDAMLAPAWSTIDNLAAYFDPATAPADLLVVLAWQLGIRELAERLDEAALRRLLMELPFLLRRAGTASCLERAVVAVTGASGRVTDSGAASAAGAPTQPWVRIELPRSAKDAEREAILILLRLLLPAQVQASVEMSST